MNEIYLVCRENANRLVALGVDRRTQEKYDGKMLLFRGVGDYAVIEEKKPLLSAEEKELVSKYLNSDALYHCVDCMTDQDYKVVELFQRLAKDAVG